MMRTAMVIAAAMTMIPGSALAGAGPGPDNDIDVAPILGTATTSAVVIQHSGGYTYGYNMSGTSVAGQGALAAVAGYQVQAGGSLGWPDLDGNGISDLVIVHTSGYQYAYLLQDDGADFVSVLSEGAIPNIPAGSSLLGWADLDGDGNDDMILQDDTTGATIAHLMSGLTASSSGAVPGLPDHGGYSTIGFPDLDGNGNADIVIQSSSGYAYAYLMSGLSVSSEGPVPSAPDVQGYSTVGFPDLDGDGDADIVIQHSGGFAFGYLMSGTTTSSSGPVPGVAGYQIIGFPDLDAQNGSDIVLQHSGGYTVGFLMAGLTSLSNGALPSLAAANGYSSIGFPNLDATEGADIVWQHSGGYTYGYLLDGTSSTGDGALPTAPPGYTTLGWENANAL
ncbi:MAG: hypothetical protein CL933_01930 [Deltaproteobacteria bacterium]|nr:hypothetical protein [Deltaproteobacteria bacterium]